jgi:hypothetical protein
MSKYKESSRLQITAGFEISVKSGEIIGTDVG